MSKAERMRHAMQRAFPREVVGMVEEETAAGVAAIVGAEAPPLLYRAATQRRGNRDRVSGGIGDDDQGDLG